jgi:hypothetical protein
VCERERGREQEHHTLFAWLPSFRGYSRAWTVTELYVGFHVYIRAWFVCDMTSPVSLEPLKGVLLVNVVSSHYLIGACIICIYMCACVTDVLVLAEKCMGMISLYK